MTRFLSSVAGACALTIGACHGGHGTLAVPPVIELPAWEGTFEGGAATDLDPKDGVVEVQLEAREEEVEIAEGRRARLWTYNGTVPGPRIEARVGDRVRVSFKNALPEETTIHWHGLRIPNAMDGAHIVQTPVAPGGGFTYEFVVPDAGTFWYHPHIRSDEQVERGLYGPIVVRGTDEPATTTDRVVVLDDVLVDTTTWQLAPFDSMHAMVGRQGNVILTNGRSHPIAEARPGGLHRFRFLNAATARYFRLALPGRRFTLIGTDGGLLESAQDVGEVLLSPGERADVLVVGDPEPGAAREWTTLAYDRGHGTGSLADATIFRMRNTAEEPVTTPGLPGTLGTIADVPAPGASRELRLEESAGPHGGGHGGGMGMSFSINGRVYPDTVPLRATLGSSEEWALVNTTEMDHPFHLHGFRFQVTSDGAGPPPFRAWRDTVNVPAKKTVVIRTRFEDNPGRWMFHCHILEHAERGMAGELAVM